MESCVASVEDQLRVADSPGLMELGLDESVTVGRDGAGAGAGAGGGAATGFLAQPKVKTAAANAVTRVARLSVRDTAVMRILLEVWNPVFEPTGMKPIVPPAGRVRAISRNTIYYTAYRN